MGRNCPKVSEEFEELKRKCGAEIRGWMKVQNSIKMQTKFIVEIAGKEKQQKLKTAPMCEIERMQVGVLWDKGVCCLHQQT